MPAESKRTLKSSGQQGVEGALTSLVTLVPAKTERPGRNILKG